MNYAVKNYIESIFDKKNNHTFKYNSYNVYFSNEIIRILKCFIY